MVGRYHHRLARPRSGLGRDQLDSPQPRQADLREPAACLETPFDIDPTIDQLRMSGAGLSRNAETLRIANQPAAKRHRTGIQLDRHGSVPCGWMVRKSSRTMDVHVRRINNQATDVDVQGFQGVGNVRLNLESGRKQRASTCAMPRA